MTTPHSVCSTKETYALTGTMFVLDGISYLTVQNVPSQGLLKEFTTFNRPKSILITIAILKVTATRFQKATSVWDSGLANVHLVIV